MESDFLAQLSYPFVLRALAAGVMVSLCSGLLGVPLVLRRLSFTGDGLSHVAFGAMAIAAAMGLSSDLAATLPVTVAGAVALFATGRMSRIRGDAALAMLSVGAMAFGYLVMNAFPASANVSGDVCDTLFGSTSILTLSSGDAAACAVLSVAVIAFQAFTWHRSFELSFDADFARVSGARISAFNAVTAAVVAVVVVIAMRLVGALLVSALLVFPAVSALRVCRSYRATMFFAALFTVVASLSGMLCAIALETPVGATVVAANIVLFAASCAAGGLRR